MSYLVLARKWRPQTFDEVVGQNHVTRTLKNALKSGRVAHALIFSGPRGVGKTSIARILAKALNCKDGPTPSPCNKCDICKEITGGHSIDVNEIDGASNRGIDEIRQLREEIRFQPVRCRFRIYIIDEVHMLTNEAFNALLKTLEEPPSHAYFIFATTEPRKLPETIHSRCQHYEFKRLSEEEIAAHLEGILEKEKIQLPDETTLLLARKAQGSLRDSLSLLDQVIAFGASSHDEVCKALGVASPVTLENLSLAILRSDVTAALGIVDDVYNAGIDLKVLCEDLLKFLRDLTIIKRLDVKSASSLARLDVKRVEALRDIFASWPYLKVLDILEVLSSSLDELYRSEYPRINLEIILMRLCSLAELTGVDTLLEKIDELLAFYEAREKDGEPGDSMGETVPEGLEIREDGGKEHEPTQDNLKKTEGNDEKGSKNDLIKEFKEFKEFLSERNPGLGGLLDACKEIKRGDNGTYILICSRDVRGEMLSERENLNELKGIARDFMGGDAVFKVELERKKNGDLKGALIGKRGRRMTARDELISSPLVQHAINIFQARISNVTFYNSRKRK